MQILHGYPQRGSDLVIYGAGHVYLLNQFMVESGMFIIEPAEKYLSDCQK